MLPILLFYTGRKYAGENLATLLEARDDELEPPMLMSDGLASRNLPKGHPVVEANCLTHGRRNFVDQLINFPKECRFVIEELRKVYRTDAECKKVRLSPVERLAIHQRDSAPIMNELRKWLQAELTHACRKDTGYRESFARCVGSPRKGACHEHDGNQSDQPRASPRS